MSRQFRFRSACFGISLTMFAVGSLGGCALPMHCGDARVTYPKHNFFLNLTSLGMMLEGYAVDLPAIPLSKAGTTEFYVNKLPPGTYEYGFTLSGGSTYGDTNSFTLTPPSASHANTVVSFRAVTLSGKNLLNSDIRLGDLTWIRSGSTLDPVKSRFKVAATDYRLFVTVHHPSSAPNEKLHIGGFGGDSRIGADDGVPTTFSIHR